MAQIGGRNDVGHDFTEDQPQADAGGRGHRGGGMLADQEYRLAFYHHMIDRYMAGFRSGKS